ncbi:MAG: tRNA lysidine(34) synthetase TilS [Gemmataceae bacterium]|nr:tRNA lysidine(34) synthetase TilS [Gemmata sp.]MDW8198819.1 tRNA lysidine(34) synthetase TilS [Gemmataceae bacterium]
MRVVGEVRHFMEDWSGPGIVAVSGGADSVALLRALHACRLPLTVAHVNHKLRGAASDADEAFVLRLCDQLGVQCRVKAVAVATLATGSNLEATARRVRYDFFVETATLFGAAWIATAHTADDHAETVLHRLIRGTGLQGLRGIAAHRPIATSTALPARASVTPPLQLIRPLLTVTRAEILAYLHELQQPFREDASNTDPRFTRNRIRHELLPLLKTFNPDVVSALAHVAEHASEAHELISVLAGELLAQAERPRAADTVVLDAVRLASAPRAVVRVALRQIWEREGWPMANMNYAAWNRAVAIAGGAVRAGDFPGGVTLRHVGRVVQLSRET